MQKFTASLAIRLYSALLGTAAVAMLPLSALLRSVRRWELRQRFGFAADRRSPDTGRVVWCHAASLGECKLMCRFVALASRRHPSDRYVLTAVTRTGVGYLRTHRPERTVAVGFLPVDTMWRMRALLRRFSVERVWIMETELWPCMLWMCRAQGVPVGVVNGRIEERPFGRYERFGVVMRPLLGSLDIVLAQDERYAARYRALGVRPDRLHIIGNLKANVSVDVVGAEQRRALRSGLGIGETETVITAGCLHPGEGSVVAEAMGTLAEMGTTCRWIVVPRHREAVAALQQELGESAVRLDDACMEVDGWKVAIVDRYGVLDDMYAMADAALVGGTFVDVGGHSLWDAARYGIPVAFGPRHYAQQASCDQLRRYGVGFEVASAAELAGRLHAVLGPEAEEFRRACEALSRRMNGEGDSFLDLLP